jgi:hypothetical protein
MRKVTLVVSEVCAGALRQFARELGARQPAGPAHLTPQWRAISPSVQLMVDPECRARSVIRDTWAPGVALALGAYAAHWRERSVAFSVYHTRRIRTSLPRMLKGADNRFPPRGNPGNIG